MARFMVNSRPQRAVDAASVAAAAAAMSVLGACYYLLISPAWAPATDRHAIISFPRIVGSHRFSSAAPAVQRPFSGNRTSALDEPWQADFAFAVSTGSLTAQRRLPLQQLTIFSYSIRNFMLIGAGADPGRSADVPIVDVATPVRQRLEALHTELNTKAASNGSGKSSADVASGTAGGQQQGIRPQPAVQRKAATAPPSGGGVEEAAAAGDERAPGRRLLSGLQRHPLWRAWLCRRGNATALRHSRRAQHLQQRRRRQQHGWQRNRRTLHQAAQHHLQPLQPTFKVRPTGRAQPSNGPQPSAGSSGLDRRRLAWVSTDDAGQAMNRYKGVPGLQALYRAFPDAKWYIMIDDDTYFFMHNFRDFITRWDPDAVHFFGNTMKYKAGTNPHTGEAFGEGYFAHGGEGIIVSRAAMRRFAGVYDQCVDRVLESRFGAYSDTQIALCMRLAGVEYNQTALRFNHFLINDPPGLDQADQAGRQWPLQTPCSRPLSVHHLRPEHMQALYDTESAAPGLRPTYEDVWRAVRRNFVTEAPERTLQVPDVWVVGNATDVMQADSKDSCEAACEARSGCVAWQWDANADGACRLHNEWHQVQALGDDDKGKIVSGVLLHRFVCNRTASAPPWPSSEVTRGSAKK